MRRFPTRPSQRAVRNALAFMSGSAVVEAAPERASRTKPEQQVMAAIKEWAVYRAVKLWRNNTGGFEWKPGRWMRFGLCTGSSDFIGLTTVTITASMIGRKVAVFTALEAKAEKGVVSDEQLQFIETIRDAGGIAGVARNAQEADEVLNNWRNLK